jgi:hypothetical protein
MESPSIDSIVRHFNRLESAALPGSPRQKCPGEQQSVGGALRVGCKMPVFSHPRGHARRSMLATMPGIHSQPRRGVCPS